LLDSIILNNSSLGSYPSAAGRWLSSACAPLVYPQIGKTKVKT